MSGYAAALDGIADEIARTGWASRSPSAFDLIPGASLIMTAGSVLLAESAAADVRAAVASAWQLIGRVHSNAQEQDYASSADDGSYRLGFLSAADAQALYERVLANPELLRDMSPAQIAVFWKYLSVEQSDALVAKDPLVIGNTSGVPLLVRIQANRLNAIEVLHSGDELSKAEKNYLALVESGQVQLVTFDPDKARIVEAINYATWDDSQDPPRFVARETPPDYVLTYVPGTSSNMEDFYKGENYQGFVNALMEGRDDSVAFVYKDGWFPGEDKPGDIPSAMSEASDQQRALDGGVVLDTFHDDVLRESQLSGAKQVAIGHSWGLADVTASEVAGAHYDEVISLAGAYMPDGWTPDPNTEYSHYSYPDWLEYAHKVDDIVPGNLVGSGDFPSENGSFEHHFYEAKDDDKLIPKAPWEIGEAYDAWMANHELIHQGYGENVPVVSDVKDQVFD